MNQKQLLWAMFFSAIAGWRYHPGAGTRGHEPLSLEQCADVADQMLELARKREDA